MNMFFFWREKSLREKKDEKRQLSKMSKRQLSFLSVLWCYGLSRGVLEAAYTISEIQGTSTIENIKTSTIVQGLYQASRFRVWVSRVRSQGGVRVWVRARWLGLQGGQGYRGVRVWVRARWLGLQGYRLRARRLGSQGQSQRIRGFGLQRVRVR